jgi:hypothetical protein
MGRGGAAAMPSGVARIHVHTILVNHGLHRSGVALLSGCTTLNNTFGDFIFRAERLLKGALLDNVSG